MKDNKLRREIKGSQKINRKGAEFLARTLITCLMM